MRALFALLAWLCVAGAAVAQPAGVGYGPGPCPFGASSCIATATGGTTARTLAQHFAECDADSTNCALYNAKDYGFSPSASAATNRNALVGASGAITAACANSGRYKKILIPAGFYRVDVSAGDWSIPCQNVAVEGAGPTGTLIQLSGTGDAWHIPAAVGFASISNMEMYRADNTTSGRYIFIEQGPVWLHDIYQQNAFGGIEIRSASSVLGENIQIGGINSLAGAYGIFVHKASSGGTLPSEISFSNINIRPSTAYSLIIRACDGCQLVNGQLGFSTTTAYLHQPEFTSDQITGVMMTNMLVSTASGTNAMRYAAQGGVMTGFEGYDQYSNVRFEVGSSDAVSFEDSRVAGVTIGGGSTVLGANNNGISVTAGTRYNFGSINFVGNNVSNGGFADIAVSAGTHVAIGVNTYGPGANGTTVAATHVAISGTADNIAVARGSDYTGGTAKILNTSSGTDITGTTFPATTGSLGGSPLAAGACSATTVAVTNSTTSMTFGAMPAADPGDGSFVRTYVSPAGTVNVKVCATTVMTPTATTYTVDSTR